jgi:cytochrome c-type biogenesis protein CcmH/NrfG
MTFVVIVAAALLAAAAAAGVMRPFGRTGIGKVELTDPLEEERAGLLRALRELDREHTSGLLSDDDYRGLRSETEARAVAVLRAVEARDGAGELAAGLRELRPPSTNNGSRRRVRRLAPVVIAGAALVALVAPLLAGAARSRSAQESISGNQATARDPIAFFKDRVREHPNDVAARLDLADRYLQASDLEHAIPEYLAALKIDPDNPEARATLGFLLYRAGRPQDGLDQVDRALQGSPNDPEALYFKGVILLDGLERPQEAVAAFAAYLEAAPFGARREEVQGLLARARAAAAKG